MRKQVFKNMEREFLEPCLDYLAKRGLENTSVRDLCKTMDISYGSLYYWFDGKDDVYVSVAKYGMDKIGESLLKAYIAEMKKGTLRFEVFADATERYKPELRLIFQITASPVYGPAVREHAEEFLAVYQKQINRLALELGISPNRAENMLGIIFSVLTSLVLWNNRQGAGNQFELLSELAPAIV